MKTRPCADASSAYICALLLGTLAFLSVSTERCVAVSVSTFFAPARSTSTGLDPNGIYPQGQKFGFGLYTINGYSQEDSTVRNMHRVAEHGFTLAGPYYNADWQNFASIYEAASEGLQFTYQIRKPTELIGVPIGERMTVLDTLSDAQMSAQVREQVAAVLSDPIARDSVARWSLGVEEVRYWYPSEMRYLQIARETIRDVETEFNVARRPFWMYEPGHRNISALKLTGAHQDFVSKGTYLTSIARGSDRSGYAIWSFTQIASVAKALRTQPQAVLQLYEDFTDPKTGTDPAEIRRVLRHDAYLALTMGMKSLNIYSMTENRPNLTTHNEQFEAYASVAQDLTGPLDLQKLFLFGEPRNDLKISISQGTKQIAYTDWYGSKFTYSGLHSFNAQVGTERYLILVNSTEQPMSVRVSGLPSSFLLDDLFAGTTKRMYQTSFTWRLDVLGVAALRFRKVGSTPSTPLGAALLLAAPEPPTWGLLVMTASAYWWRPRRGSATEVQQS